MESMNSLSDSKSSTCAGRQGPLCPYPLQHVSPSYGNLPTVGLKGNTQSVGGLDYHQRFSSDSLFMEGQLSWLDDLLNEPDTEIVHRGHRRSASDTFAYIGATAKSFDTQEEPNQKNVTSIWAQNIGNFKGSNELNLEPSSLEEKFKNVCNLDSNAAVSRSAERHERKESCSQTLERSIEVTSSSQAKPSVSKPDTKRGKQQSAHRTQVMKLQYIAQLERTVQVLQATESKISAELEFLDHQNLILKMENRALKQRLDSLSQEQFIKQLEHEMLERELGRLQALCRLQGQEQMRINQLQQQNSKHRRTKSRDASSFRGPVNGPVQI